MRKVKNYTISKESFKGMLKAGRLNPCLEISFKDTRPAAILTSSVLAILMASMCIGRMGKHLSCRIIPGLAMCALRSSEMTGRQGVYSLSMK